MGTPGFAAGVLDHLLHERYNVVGVITAPDKPAGRGLELHQSEVKKCAVAHSLAVLQPVKLKDPSFLEELRSLKADLFIVVAFRMLPEAVWQMPALGTFNLHASLLPDYRGAAPINRAIMMTGITTFFLQQEIDTGSIIFRKEIPIGEQMTAGELHDLMMAEGALLVAETVNAVAQKKVKPLPQSEFRADGAPLHDAPKIFKDDCRIDWTKKAKTIHDHIRGLSPYPAAWTELHNGKEIIQVKVYRSTYEIALHDLKPGTITDDLKVAVHDGFIRITELQSQGKKKMDSASWLRGFRLTDGAFFS
jgi:methionyl-tRNA formyltransferase